MDGYPYISIITPTLNSEKYIRFALESINFQNYPHIETIIVDGGSTDNTIKIAEQYSPACVLVKPGLGIYGSLNEGIAASSGQIVGFLNSDARGTAPGCVRACAEAGRPGRFRDRFG